MFRRNTGKRSLVYSCGHKNNVFGQEPYMWEKWDEDMKTPDVGDLMYTYENSWAIIMYHTRMADTLTKTS